MPDCMSVLCKWMPSCLSGRNRRLSRLSCIFAMFMLFVTLVALRSCIQHYQQVKKFMRLQDYQMELQRLMKNLHSLEKNNAEIQEEVFQLEKLINGTLMELRAPT